MRINIIIQEIGDVSIGEFTMLASNSCIYANNHFAKLKRTPFRYQGSRVSVVKIGTNYWIGPGVTVLDGASLGSNSVVGANCVISGAYAVDSLICESGAKGLYIPHREISNEQ